MTELTEKVISGIKIAQIFFIKYRVKREKLYEKYHEILL